MSKDSIILHAYCVGRDKAREWIIWGVSIGVTAAAAYALYNDFWSLRNDDTPEAANDAAPSEHSTPPNPDGLKTGTAIDLPMLGFLSFCSHVWMCVTSEICVFV